MNGGVASRTVARLVGLFVVLIAPMLGPARAAQLYTEPFATAAGWIGTGSWQSFGVSNGTLAGVLPPSVPFPATGSFVATNASSSGNFVGNYAVAGARVIGFSFLASDILPSDLTFKWRGGTNNLAYFRGGLQNFMTTGTWYTFTFSLASKEAGGWQGSSTTNFTTALQNVTWLEILVTGQGAASQRYAVDNVFIDTQPDVNVAWNGTTPVEVIANRLRTNAVYRLAASTNLLDGIAWTNLPVFTATNRTQVCPDATDTNATMRFFRLLQPEHAP